MPNIEAKPALRPCDRLRATTYRTPGPGLTVRRNVARAKSSTVVGAGIRASNLSCAPILPPAGRSLRPPLSWLPYTRFLAAVVLRHLVDRDRDAEHEHLVLPRRDGDAVHEIRGEPLLGDRGHDRVARRDLEFVVQDVAGRLELAVAGDVDAEALTEDVDERLAHRRHDLAPTLDVHRPPQGEHLGLHPGQLVAADVLEYEGLRQSQHLAVQPIDVLALGVLDPEVLAQGEELPSELEGRPSGDSHHATTLFVAGALRPQHGGGAPRPS